MTAQTGEKSTTDSSSVEWFSVDEKSVALVWPTLEPLVSKALLKFGDEWSSGAVLQQILKGELFLWAGVADGEVVAGLFWKMKVSEKGSKIWLEFIVGRDIARWTDTLIEHIREVKEATGAHSVAGVCRPGLARILERQGLASRLAVVMRMD